MKTISILLFLLSLNLAVGQDADWPVYLGGKERNLYSTLKQINRDTVSKLEVAWTFETGEKAEYQANNLIVDGVLFTPTQTRKIVALNGATGKEIWTWDPVNEKAGKGRGRQRGFAYWKNNDGGEARLFTAVAGLLFAVDPKTGETVRSFGEDGSIELGSGLNTPGVIFEDKLIVGGVGGKGAVRAFDVRTGEQKWIFHLIPRPGEVGHDTWPEDAWKTATGLMPWCGQSLDEERGIVYVATKTAEPDFYGGKRHGKNLFANCILALDAKTGERIWHFQIVHHDLLDKDLPCPPVLLTVTHEGKKVAAVAQGSKHGLLFVFDRVTGKPLWPIEERPVPKSNLKGEKAWPTQPFPTKPEPLMRQKYTEADVSTISPETKQLTLDRIRASPNFGPFPAPSLNETVMFPGFDGGMEWGGGAADPDGIYYVNINEMPWLFQMVETRRADGSPLIPGEKDYMVYCGMCHGLDRKGNAAAEFPPLIDILKRKTLEEIELITRVGGGRMPGYATMPEAKRNAIINYLVSEEAPQATANRKEPGIPESAAKSAQPTDYAFGGFRRWLDPEGYPAIKPPWGTLNAVDLNSGEIKWKVTLGEYPELTARGIPPTGTENYGGPLVTAGGLIFIGATADETFRVFDKETGEVLWKAKLPFGGNATPSTYMIDGRQYVAISAGGGKSGRPKGGSLVVFALPESKSVVANDPKPDLTPLISKKGPLLFEDDFDGTEIKAEWVGLHGTQWEVVDGTLKGMPSPKAYQEKQIARGNAAHSGKTPSSRLMVPADDCIMQFRFKLSENLVGAHFGFNDGTVKTGTGHVGRFVATRKTGLALQKDKNAAIKGDKDETLTTNEFNLKPDTWYWMMLEVIGDEIVAQVSGAPVLRAKHPRLDIPKDQINLPTRGGGVIYYDQVRVWKATRSSPGA